MPPVAQCGHDTLNDPNRGSRSLPTPPSQEPTITDDVYDALLQLGPYSVTCLADKLMDSRWMPDPREEPPLGAPVVGDVAYMILGDKGVPDVLPKLAHKKPNELRMDGYFTWPRVGDHRQRSQPDPRSLEGVKKHRGQRSIPTCLHQ